jgi:hypothetical protein
MRLSFGRPIANGSANEWKAPPCPFSATRAIVSGSRQFRKCCKQPARLILHDLLILSIFRILRGCPKQFLFVLSSASQVTDVVSCTGFTAGRNRTESGASFNDLVAATCHEVGVRQTVFTPSFRLASSIIENYFMTKVCFHTIDGTIRKLIIIMH